MLPKKYRAKNVNGEWVVGYPAPTMIAINHSISVEIEDSRTIWAMYTDDFFDSQVISAGTNITCLETKKVMIDIDTLEEIGD